MSAWNKWFYSVNSPTDPAWFDSLEDSHQPYDIEKDEGLDNLILFIMSQDMSSDDKEIFEAVLRGDGWRTIGLSLGIKPKSAYRRFKRAAKRLGDKLLADCSLMHSNR